MKFSVIIPVWNQADYLPDALDSVLEQTYAPSEIIIVDDGSPDSSGEIAERYADKRNIKVIHQVNKGLASARNTGIMNATGEYILPLDADDILLPECIQKMVAVAKQTKADIIAPSFKNFGVINEPVILGGIPTLEDFRIANRLPYFSAIKREALLECGGYQHKMSQGYEDYHLWFDLLSRGKTIALIQEILVLYRTKSESMLTKAQKYHGELMTQIAKDFPSVFSI